jgi:hypothetical protein
MSDVNTDTVEFVSSPNVSCLSVAGGWQSFDNSLKVTFGPAFHEIFDLWTWQKENITPDMVVVRNLMSGEGAGGVLIAKDTPWCCNPASETYWSM